MYLHGRGVPQDDTRAVEWYRKAAEQGYAKAQNNLGWMYQRGQGVAKDEVEAANWYRKAADQGDVLAQQNMGYMYANGLGVSEDYVLACKWWLLAASAGNEDARKFLVDLVNRMTREQIARAKKMVREWKPVSER